MDKIGTLIKKSLEHFDQQNYDNIELLNIDDKKFAFNEETDRNLDKELDTDPRKNYKVKEITRYLKNETYDIEQLALFDSQTKTWIWSWCIPIISKTFIQESKYLLEYGLSLNVKLDQEDFYYLKVLLTNSRVNIEDEIQLEIMLAVCSYLLGSRIKCIYRKTIDGKNNNDIIYFYLIKNIY